MVSILGSVARGSEDTLSSAAGRTLEPVAVELAKLEAGKGGGGGGGGVCQGKRDGWWLVCQFAWLSILFFCPQKSLKWCVHFFLVHLYPRTLRALYKK